MSKNENLNCPNNIAWKHLWKPMKIFKILKRRFSDGSGFRFKNYHWFDKVTVLQS